MMCNRATGCDTEPRENSALAQKRHGEAYLFIKIRDLCSTRRLMGDSSMRFPARCSSRRGEALEGEQFVPGLGAVCVELEHLLLEVLDDTGSFIFPVKAEKVKHII